LLVSNALRPATGGDTEGGIAAFGTPTVVHFSLALLLSAMLCAPWHDDRGLRATLGVLGAGALVYAAVVLRRARRQRSYETTAYDWVWHVLLPAAAYAAILLSAVLLGRGAEGPFLAIAAATLLLLCIGIHNAWDTVTYLTVSALRTGVLEARPAGRQRSGEMSLPAVTIRPAAPADLKAMGRLGALLVRIHHDFDPDRFIAATPRTEDAYGSFLGTQLDQPNVIILVAERDGEVVGYAFAGVEGNDYMSLRGPAGVLHDIVVDSAHRGQGVGRVLLDATLEALRAKGAPRVVLSTAERNESAQRLFARAGFRRTMIEMTRESGAKQ
jgi:ribosomal protein S18 acetylase RimI-like enzyme